MSIETTRCWHVTGLPDDEVYDSPCWPDAQDAASCAAEVRAAGHEGVGYARRDQDCLWAECDGCDVRLEDDDAGALVHEPDRATLDGLLAGDDWIVTADGRVLCPDCNETYGSPLLDLEVAR